MQAVYTVKVGEETPAAGGKPSAGPVYRSIYAKGGLMQLPQEIQSPWDFFSGAVKKYPNNRMLGRRQVSDGKAGEYVWQTYEEVYQKVMKIGSAIRSFGVKPLKGFEMLKAVHLEPVPFSIDKDLITPTFKLKRPQLLKYYKDCIDQLYEDAKVGTTH